MPALLLLFDAAQLINLLWTTLLWAFDLKPMKLVMLEPIPKELNDFPDLVENFFCSFNLLGEGLSLFGN